MASSITSGPATLDWKVYAGDANKELLQFYAADQPWNLTGATITAQARKTASDPTAALTATCTVETASGTGIVSVAWDGEQVRTLLGASEEWTGVWDLQVKETGQTLPRTVLRGVFSAVMDVTRTP